MRPAPGEEDGARTGALQWSLPILSGREDVFPATEAQVGMWLAHELSDRPEGFIVRLVHRIEGSLDVGRLESSINEVILSHEMLRSTFSLAGDTLMVKASESASVALVNQSLPADERELRRVFSSALHRRWNLLGDPLLRIIIGQVDETTYVLGLFVHHAVVDSESLALVLEDIADAFAGNSPRDRIVGSYRTLRVAQDGLREGPAHDQALERWRQILQGAPKLSRPEPEKAATFPGEFQVLERSLNVDEAEALRRTAAHHKATSFVVMFAGLALALSSLIGRSDVIIGTAVSKRFQSEWERVVGLFVDFAPVRVRSSGETLALGAAIEQVRCQLGHALSYPSIGFAEIVAAVNPERSTDERPLFQVYATQEWPDVMRLHLPNLDTTPLEVRELQYPADIGFELMLGDLPTIVCTWDPSRHSSDTVQTLLGGLLNRGGGPDGTP